MTFAPFTSNDPNRDKKRAKIAKQYNYRQEQLMMEWVKTDS